MTTASPQRRFQHLFLVDAARPRTGLGIFVFLCLVASTHQLFSQEPPRLINVRRQNIRLDEVVVELSFPDELPPAVLDYPIVNVIWLTEGNKQIQQAQVQIHPGVGLYDLRATPGWTGKLLGYQAILQETRQPVPMKLVPPTLSDELALSASPQPFNVNRINHANDLPRILGIPVLVWSLVVVIVPLLVTRVLLQLTRGRALLISFAIGFLTWEIRGWLDHTGMRTRFASMNHHLPMTGMFREFALETQKIMAAHQSSGTKPTWAHDGMNQMPRFQLRYHLAEFPWTSHPDQADFRITTVQKNSQPASPVLYQKAGLVLLDQRPSAQQAEVTP